MKSHAAVAFAQPSAAANAWRAYQTSTGEVDEKELIVRYLPLVRNVVDRIKINLPAHVDVDDLYSVGGLQPYDDYSHMDGDDNSVGTSL